MGAPGPRPRPLGRLIAVAVVAAVALASVTVVLIVPHSAPTPAGCNRTWEATPATSSPIQHLFVIVKENHAFENYFGSIPGVTGNPPNGTFPLTFNGTATVSPYPLNGTSTPDLPHDAASELTDYDHGKNDLFVATADAAGVGDPSAAVGYYTASQLPAYFDYAHYYALGDHFFSGDLGPTYPNRVFDISAANLSGWNADTTPPSSVTVQPTVLEQLTRANLTWYYDQEGLPLPVAPQWFPGIMTDPCSAGRIAAASDLAGQLASGIPPAVVFFDPSNSQSYSEHPPENVTLGESWTVAVVNAVFSSPLASSSAVLIFFDENGGFWDPVPPPMTTTGLDGFRVPFLVLSPYTPAGKVCSVTLDPASVLHFIDANWNLPFLNSRVAGATNLSCFFDFSQTPRPPLLLGTGVTLTTGGSPGPVPIASMAAEQPPATPVAPIWTRAAALVGRSESFWPPRP